jgi:hypothetical protein
LPLAAHAAVHAVATFTISFFFTNIVFAIALAAFDFITHFTVDRLKASPSLLGRFKALSANDFLQLKALRDELQRIGHPFEVANVDEKFKSNTYFWWSLGLDQMLHHLTHYVIIFVLAVL